MFGNQTVGIVTVTQTGSPGYLGIKDTSEATVSVGGCRFREARQPYSPIETPEQSTNVVIERWKLTAPPEAGALAAQSTGELVYNGESFKIDGPAIPKFDMNGTVHHVTIFCTRQLG